MNFCTNKGQKYVTPNYCINLEAGYILLFLFGKDNIHFQILQGEKKVDRLVFNAMK